MKHREPLRKLPIHSHDAGLQPRTQLGEQHARRRYAESDQSLIVAMIAGDEAAFHEFFDIYSQRVYRFAVRRLGGDLQGAEEVTQSTLVNAMRNLRTLRGEAALFIWRARTALRAALKAESGSTAFT